MLEEYQYQYHADTLEFPYPCDPLIESVAVFSGDFQAKGCILM